jgi:hypothetical protein
MNDSTFGTYEERNGVLSEHFEGRIKTVVRELTEPKEDPLLVVKAAYPRIYKMIVDLWGTDLLHLRLSKMVALDTEGREGFDKPVGLALMAIHDKHMTQFKFEPIWFIPDMRRDTW